MRCLGKQKENYKTRISAIRNPSVLDSEDNGDEDDDDNDYCDGNGVDDMMMVVVTMSKASDW